VILKFPRPGRRDTLAGAIYGSGTYGGGLGSLGVGGRGGGAGSEGGGGGDSLSGVGDRRRTGMSRKWNAGGMILRAVVWVGRLILTGVAFGGDGGGGGGDAGRVAGVGGSTFFGVGSTVMDGSENGDILDLAILRTSARGTGTGSGAGVRFFSGGGVGSGGGGAASSGGGGGGGGVLILSSGGGGGASSGGVGGRSEGGGGGKRGDLGRVVALVCDVGKAIFIGVLVSFSGIDVVRPELSCNCERLGGVLERERGPVV
jgi:hypothetical protein